MTTAVIDGGFDSGIVSRKVFMEVCFVEYDQ